MNANNFCWLGLFFYLTNSDSIGENHVILGEKPHNETGVATGYVLEVGSGYLEEAKIICGICSEKKTTSF